MAKTPRLPAELNIYAVATVRPQFEAWAEPPKRKGRSKGAAAALCVDGSAVAEVDGAGVQLLIALANSLRAGGRELRVTDPSGALENALRTLGVGALTAIRAEETA
jgi:phospholipid transport system transporter-binding protein